MSFSFPLPPSDAFFAQAAEAKTGVLLDMLRPWFRTIAFFLAFLVLPGLLGGLKITSDRFNVGLMVGGFLAMILDGYMMMPRRYRSQSAGIDRFDKCPLQFDRAGLTIILPDRRVTYGWSEVRKASRHRLGLVLHLKSRRQFALDFSQLPAPVSANDLVDLIKIWRGQPALRIKG